jgi:hypothetical protein
MYKENANYTEEDLKQLEIDIDEEALYLITWNARSKEIMSTLNMNQQ